MSIGFIGAGNMAYALVSGIIEAGHIDEDIWVSDPKTCVKERFCTLSPRIHFTNNNNDVFLNCRLVVLAVKPQQLAGVFSAAAQVFQQVELDQVLCSVAAGVSCSTINSYLPKSLTVVRAMPNTPALIGCGITGLYSADASPQKRADVEMMFSSVGSVLWVEDESLMQAITATSGSGPAYFFAFMEMMVTGAKALGLAEQEAQKLVIQTALGASELAARQKTSDLAALREQVTSPGGTTEAGLKVFCSEAQKTQIAATLQAAYQRAIELENS